MKKRYAVTFRGKKKPVIYQKRNMMNVMLSLSDQRINLDDILQIRLLEDEEGQPVSAETGADVLTLDTYNGLPEAFSFWYGTNTAFRYRATLRKTRQRYDVTWEENGKKKQIDYSWQMVKQCLEEKSWHIIEDQPASAAPKQLGSS